MPNENADIGDDEVLTIDNCPDLAFLLTSDFERTKEFTKTFVEKYKGKIIEFDGSVDSCDPYFRSEPLPDGSYMSKNEYEIQITVGNYNPDGEIVGPTMFIECLSNITMGLYPKNELPWYMNVGSNIRARLKILRTAGLDEDICVTEYVLIEPR